MRSRKVLIGAVVAAVVAIVVIAWWRRGGAERGATGGSAAGTALRQAQEGTGSDDPWNGVKKPIHTIAADDDPTIASTGAPAVVEGTVRDATTHAPVSGAEVAYWSKKGELTTESAGDGHYRIELTTGAWSARASLGDDAMSKAHVIRVDAPTLTVDLELEKLAHVHGVVRDAQSHAAVAGVEVTYDSADKATREALEATAGRSTLSAADGGYKLAVPSGELRLLAKAQGKLAHKAIPNVAAGADVTADLELRKDVAIDGRVVDGKGAPVAGATVVVFIAIYDVDLNHKRTVVTGADGRFAARDLEPGTMTIDAHTDDGSASEPKMIDVSAGDMHDIVLTMSSPIAIRGRVRYADGRPARDAVVKVRRSGIAGAFAERSTNADGIFELEGPSGSLYDVTASNEYGTARLIEAKPDAQLELTLHVPGGLRGHVHAKSAPSTDYTVTIDRMVPAGNERALPPPPAQRYTPADGVFEWPKLDPGTYDLTVRAGANVGHVKGAVVPDGAWVDVDVLVEPDGDAAARRPK